LKNSTSGKTNTGRVSASDVHRGLFLVWQPSFQQFWAIHRPSPIEPAGACCCRGVLSQPSNLNLDAWKQSAGVVPRRLDIVLRSSGCDTLQRAVETFKTSIELIDPAQKPIQPPDTRRGEIKIFDPSSSSPIHLWSKSKISNLKSKSTNRFPQSTSLAKINRWMLWLAVFGRSKWLVEGLLEPEKMPRGGKKVQV